MGYARLKAAQLGGQAPAEPSVDAMEKKYQAMRPAIASSVRGSEFQLSANEPYSRHLKEHPDALKSIGITAQQATAVLNYVNGRRSITEIRHAVAGELDEDVSLAGVVAYLELLKTFKWVEF